MIDRRTFFGGSAAGLVGFLFTRDAEGDHELVDRGLSHEEMAQMIVESGVLWSVEAKDKTSKMICHSAKYLVVGREKSIVIIYHLNLDLSLRVVEKFDLSHFQIAKMYDGDDSETYGCIGERWFQLG